LLPFSQILVDRAKTAYILHPVNCKSFVIEKKRKKTSFWPIKRNKQYINKSKEKVMAKYLAAQEWLLFHGKCLYLTSSLLYKLVRMKSMA
jgi:hypothetical protein